jgi:hypothetical protein
MRFAEMQDFMVSTRHWVPKATFLLATVVNVSDVTAGLATSTNAWSGTLSTSTWFTPGIPAKATPMDRR